MDPSGEKIMLEKPAGIAAPLVAGKERASMIVDGFIFGLCIMLAYIITFRLTKNADSARTIAFAVTVISPQISIYFLRDGSLRDKFTRPNALLFVSNILTIVLFALIIVIKPLNIVFKTFPVSDWRLWALALGLSSASPLNRLILRRKE